MVKDSFTKWYTIKAIQELNEKVEKGNSSLGSRYVSLLDEQKLLKKDYNNLSLRLHSVIEENTDLKQKLSLDQAKIQSLEKQLTELKKENSEKLISLEERIKNMEGSRYAKK